MLCIHCGYRGNSGPENNCPRCGHVGAAQGPNTFVFKKKSGFWEVLRGKTSRTAPQAAPVPVAATTSKSLSTEPAASVGGLNPIEGNEDPVDPSAPFGVPTPKARLADSGKVPATRDERRAAWALWIPSQLSQMAGVLGVVTVFFMAFVLLLMVLFPAAGPAGIWIRKAAFELPSSLVFASTGSFSTGPNLSVWSPGQDSPYDLGDGRPLAALLTYKKNDVRSRRSEDIVWNDAFRDMPLYDRDAVQTLKRSRAIVTFDESNFLDLDENAMIIIKRLSDDPVLKDRRAFMVVVDGNLRGRIEATPDREMNVSIITVAGEVRVQTAKTSEKRAEFSVAVNPDKSTTLTVFEGEATLSALGKSITVQANELARVQPNEEPKGPVTILGSVALSRPAADAAYVYRDLPPRIRFDWKASAGAKQYHVQIARDSLFRERVVDEVTTDIRFMFGNLREGEYLWRVSGIDADGSPGAPSEPRPIHVVLDRQAPVLDVLFPSADAPMRAESLTIRGRSEPDARVFLNGTAVRVNKDGSFSTKAPLKMGANLVVVESVDPAGNTTYKSQVIHRKP